MIPVLRGTVDSTTAESGSTPLLVLGPSLGTRAESWGRLAPAFAAGHRVLRFDLPGHGVSPSTGQPFTVAELADAVVALVDSVGGGRFSYAGVSLGGAIGIELALGPHARRLDSLAVICSAARIATAESWLERAAQVRRQGTASLVASSSRRWFAPGFLERDPGTGGGALTALVDVDDESYATCCEALAAFDRRGEASAIAVPTLVATGDSDPVVSAEEGDELAAAVSGSSRVVLEHTGHQAHVEAPAGLLIALLDLLGTGAPTEARSRYRAGLDVRRAVLGDEHVDASLAATTAETADFQQFITEVAWGTIWTRPGLDRRMRSAVTLSSLVTGHHWNELALHVRAGLTNGLSRDELVEILLQTAVYAGVPAANSAFGVARRIFAELDSVEAVDKGTGAAAEPDSAE